MGHYKSFYNVCDTLILVLYWFFYAYLASNPKVIHYDSWNNLTTIYLLIVVYRGVIHLRCIDQVRYLIAMIQMVFYDMLPFFTVLIISIVSLACVHVQASKIEGTDTE